LVFGPHPYGCDVFQCGHYSFRTRPTTEAIASKLNVTVEWHNVGFDTMIPSIQSGELDLGVSGFSVTSDRLQIVQFTMPHSVTEGQIIMLNSTKTAKGIGTLTSISQLSTLNLKVGTQTGTTEEGELLGAIPHGLVTSRDISVYFH